MKMINILLIVIFILFAILGIRVYTSNKEPEYSLQEIQEILDRAEDITNYECIINEGYGLAIKCYKRLDDKVYLEPSSSDTQVKTIINYNTNIGIGYEDNKKVYFEQHNDTKYIYTSNFYTGGMWNNTIQSIADFVEILNVKEENYKDTECFKVEIKLKTNNVIMWINIDNGLIMKIKNAADEVHEFSYKFNTVTDKDVNPDLTGYKKLK